MEMYGSYRTAKNWNREGRSHIPVLSLKHADEEEDQQCGS